MTESPPRLPAFAASLREAPYNRRLGPGLGGGARAAAAEVGLVEPRHFPLPFHESDIGVAGRPGNERGATQALARAAATAGVVA